MLKWCWRCNIGFYSTLFSRLLLLLYRPIRLRFGDFVRCDWSVDTWWCNISWCWCNISWWIECTFLVIMVPEFLIFMEEYSIRAKLFRFIFMIVVRMGLRFPRQEISDSNYYMYGLGFERKKKCTLHRWTFLIANWNKDYFNLKS